MSFSDVPRDVASGHLFGAVLALPDVCLPVLPAGAFSGLKAANFEVVSQPGLARLDVAALPAFQLKNKQQQTNFSSYSSERRARPRRPEASVAKPWHALNEKCSIFQFADPA